MGWYFTIKVYLVKYNSGGYAIDRKIVDRNGGPYPSESLAYSEAYRYEAMVLSMNMPQGWTAEAGTHFWVSRQ